MLQRLDDGKLQRNPAVQDLDTNRARAHGLLAAPATEQAFDVSHEPAKLRTTYGQTRYGQSVLLARRLVEAGVRLVLVSDTTENTNGKWDTHKGGYPAIKRNLLETDMAIAALLDDLRERGLADSTVVAWMAEFGRTPKMGQNGSRDHWPKCYSLLLAGGGIKGGQVFGASDNIAAYPSDRPVAPEDILATVYQDRKSTRLNSSHIQKSRMPSSA